MLSPQPGREVRVELIGKLEGLRDGGTTIGDIGKALLEHCSSLAAKNTVDVALCRNFLDSLGIPAIFNFSLEGGQAVKERALRLIQIDYQFLLVHLYETNGRYDTATFSEISLAAKTQYKNLEGTTQDLLPQMREEPTQWNPRQWIDQVDKLYRESQRDAKAGNSNYPHPAMRALHSLAGIALLYKAILDNTLYSSGDPLTFCRHQLPVRAVQFLETASRFGLGSDQITA